MDDLEFYRNRFQIEADFTRSVLDRLPPALLDYRPHPKAPSAGDLFWTIVRGLQIRLDILTTNEAEGPPVAPRPSHERMLASYLDLTQRLTAALSVVDEKRRTTQAQFRTNGGVAAIPGARPGRPCLLREPKGANV